MASEAEAETPAQRTEEQPMEVAEEQPKEEEREREDEEGSELSKKRKDKKKKKHKSEKRKNRDRSRERSASRDRSRDRSRRRSRERSRDRSRRRSGSRDRERDRERERERDRRRDRDPREDSRDRRYRSSRRRSGSRSYRRRRSESRDRRSSSRRRDDRREKSKSKDRTDGGSGVNIPGVPTLKEIMFENPGMSVVEALRRQAEIKAAMGIEVPGLNAPRVTPYGAPVSYGAPGAFGGVGGFSSAGGFTGGGLPGTLAPGFTGGAMAPRAAAAAVAGSLPSAATKVHRELYVGNLPPGVQSAQIIEFMNSAMVSANLVQQPGPSVLNAWVSSDGHYAFVEFRSPEEATSAVNFLNNIAFGSYNLRIGRPRGYVADATVASSGGGLGLGTIAVPGMPSITPAIPGVGAAAAEQSNTLMLTNLPKDVAADQVRELVTAFGPVKAFNMIVDPNGKARATAVFEYEDSSLTEGVINGLTDFELGDQKLGIQRVPASVAATLLQPVGQLPDLEPTRTLRLSNMVTAADMADPEVMEEIKEDVADECNKYGTVLSVEAPMSGDGASYIFVQFANTDGCGRAKQAIGGRLFNGNTVAAQYYPDELFEQKTFQAPSGYFDRK